MTAKTPGRLSANSSTLTTSSGNRTRSRSYDARGNNEARARRSEKLLSDPQFHHTEVGKDVHCAHCGTMLTYERGSKSNTLEQDKRNPSKGYKYENIQPSCRSCNINRSNDIGWVHPSKVTT